MQICYIILYKTTFFCDLFAKISLLWYNISAIQSFIDAITVFRLNCALFQYAGYGFGKNANSAFFPYAFLK